MRHFSVMAAIKPFWGFGRLRSDRAEAAGADAAAVAPSGGDPVISAETLLISPTNGRRAR